MRDLMREIVNRLYTFHIRIDDAEFRATGKKWEAFASRWDDPDDDIDFVRLLAEEG